MSYNPHENLGDFSDDIGLGAEDKDRVRTNQVEWYKVTTKGQTDRVALVYFHPVDVVALKKAKSQKPDLTEEQQRQIVAKVRAAHAEKLGKKLDELDMVDLLDTSESRFKAVDASFQEGLGYVAWPKVLSNDERALYMKLPEKRTYVMTTLLKYPVKDKDGTVDKARLKSGDWAILPWRFSPDKYEKLRKINKGLVEAGQSLAHYDLYFQCKEPQFQNIDITQAGPAIWRMDKEFSRAVLTQATALYSKLNPFRTLTSDELRAKLGLGGAPVAGSSFSTEDFSDVLGNV